MSIPAPVFQWLLATTPKLPCRFTDHSKTADDAGQLTKVKDLKNMVRYIL